MRLLNLSQIATSFHPLNFSTVSDMNSVPMREYRALDQETLKQLRAKVIGSAIPEEYVLQVKTQNQVLDKIDRLIKKQKAA